MAEPRVTISLLPRAVDALDRTVARSGMSKTDTINRALQLYDYLDDLAADGADVLVRKRGSDELTQLRWF